MQNEQARLIDRNPSVGDTLPVPTELGQLGLPNATRSEARRQASSSASSAKPMSRMQ